MPCLWPSPERGRITAARPGSAMWIETPVGTSSVCAGRERDRRVDAGAQVHAGGAGRRVGGQVRADALVEDLSVEFAWSAWARSASTGAAGAARSRRPAAARARACPSAAAGARRRRRAASPRCRRCPARPARGWRSSAAASCAGACPRACGSTSWLSAAKPTQYGASGARGDGREDVDGRLQRDRERRVALLDLRARDGARACSRRRRRRRRRRRHRASARVDRARHVGGADDVDARDARPAWPAASARRPASRRRRRRRPPARARSPSCPSSSW